MKMLPSISIQPCLLQQIERSVLVNFSSKSIKWLSCPQLGHRYLTPQTLCAASTHSMPVGGKLTLKGGVPLGGGVKKKRSTKNRKAAEDAEQQQEVADAVPVDELPASLKAVLNADEKKEAPLAVVRKEDQIYEKEFEMEMERAKTGRSKTTPWGSGYGKLPEGGRLHGYAAPVKGVTPSERLDLRAAMKADKFCK